MKEEVRTDREDQFVGNLFRMAGRTDAVTPDTMMEFCVHLHNESIPDLLSIEQDYTAELFNDEVLDVVICSMEVGLHAIRYGALRHLTL
jgi:hypothetical protein